MDLIFRCSCLKAFTRSPLLTPVPRRSKADCDKNDAMPKGGARRLLRAQEQAITVSNPDVVVAG